MTHLPFDDGDPHLVFQHRHSEDGKNVRLHLEHAMTNIITESSERDFTILYDALNDLKRRDPLFYQSLRGQLFARVLMDAVEDEDRYRCQRGIAERSALA